jgi:protein gp37
VSVSSTSTAIEWTDATWNPVTGCSKVSEGCRNCYAAALAPRLAAMGKDGYTDLPWTKKNAPLNVHMHADRLDAPLRWAKPRKIFVNSMSDLFHELVPFGFVDRVFAVMALAPRHTFQVLTKRPERMADYFDPGRLPERELAILDAAKEFVGQGAPHEGKGLTEHLRDRESILPLPNAWLGTSVEDGRVVERIDHLRRAPAAVRFLSCEPLIGPLDGLDLEGVHWVIVGGESGRGHRPIEAQWVRDIRTQTGAAGAAFFFKQWGGAKPKAGGRELDGRTYDEMPKAWVAARDSLPAAL